MNTEAVQMRQQFLQRAQKAFLAAKQAGRLGAKCCCEMSQSEPDHHLWIRSTDDAEMRKGMHIRAAGYFDLALVPLCNPKRLAIRLWTEDGGAGINAKLKCLFAEGADACGRKGLECVHSRNLLEQPNGNESNDPHGLYDFYRSEFADWTMLTDEQLNVAIDDYLAIEDVISRAGLW